MAWKQVVTSVYGGSFRWAEKMFRTQAKILSFFTWYFSCQFGIRNHEEKCIHFAMELMPFSSPTPLTIYREIHLHRLGYLVVIAAVIGVIGFLVKMASHEFVEYVWA